MSNFRVWFVLQLVVYYFYVLEGPNGNIFCILYLFYKCFVKTDVRVCEGFPVFEFCLFDSVLAVQCQLCSAEIAPFRRY